jgi:hypothetical protein
MSCRVTIGAISVRHSGLAASRAVRVNGPYRTSPDNSCRLVAPSEAKYLVNHLQEAVGDHPPVGEVRGLGMLAAVEFQCAVATACL